MSTPSPDPIFEPLPSGHLEAQLDSWVDSFPVDAIRLHLEELERQKGDIESAMESLKRRLHIWQAMNAHSRGRAAPVKKPSKRDAVLNLLERDGTRDFALAEIRAAMIEGGLLEDTKQARHALEVTVSNMVKRGEIERPRKGFYRLSRSAPVPTPEHQAAPPTNLQRREDEAA